MVSLAWNSKSTHSNEGRGESVDYYNPLGHRRSVQTVVETSVFVRRAEKLLGQEEHDELITYLATHPLAGDAIVRHRRRPESQIRGEGER